MLLSTNQSQLVSMPACSTACGKKATATAGRKARCRVFVQYTRIAYAFQRTRGGAHPLFSNAPNTPRHAGQSTRGEIGEDRRNEEGLTSRHRRRARVGVLVVMLDAADGAAVGGHIAVEAPRLAGGLREELLVGTHGDAVDGIVCVDRTRREGRGRGEGGGLSVKRRRARQARAKGGSAKAAHAHEHMMPDALARCTVSLKATRYVSARSCWLTTASKLKRLTPARQYRRFARARFQASLPPPAHAVANRPLFQVL